MEDEDINASVTFRWAGYVLLRARRPASSIRLTDGLSGLQIPLVALLCFFASTRPVVADGDASPDKAGLPVLVPPLGHTDSVLAVAISPDGTVAVTGSGELNRIGVHFVFGRDNTARIWDVATGREMRRLVGHTDRVTAVAISHSGRLILTGSRDQTAQIWDAASGLPLNRLVGHSDEITGVQFSPDDRWVVTVGGEVALWSVEPGRTARTFGSEVDQFEAAALSVDGRRLLTGGRKPTGSAEPPQATMWDTATGYKIGHFTVPSLYMIESVDLSPDGRSALISGMGAFKGIEDLQGGTDRALLVNTETGELVRTLRGPPPPEERDDRILRFSASFTGNGRQILTVGGWGESTRLFNTDDGALVREYPQAPHIAAAATSDGRWVLTAGADNAAHLWESSSGREIRTLGGRVLAPVSVSASPGGHWLLTGDHNRLWDLATGREAARFTWRGREADTRATALSHDGHWLVVGCEEDNSARLLALPTGTEVRRFHGHTKILTTVAISPDGRRVLTGSLDDTSRIWALDTGLEVRRLQTPHAISCAFSRRDVQRAITLGADTRVWNVELGAELIRFPSSAVVWGSVALSPADESALCAGDIGVQLWNTSTGQLMREFEGLLGARNAEFSPDGRLVLVHGLADGKSILFDARTGEQLRTMSGLAAEAHATFSHDGRFLFEAAHDGRVRVSAAHTGAEVCSLLSFVGGNWAVVAPDGRFDAGTIEDLEGMSWLMPDTPFAPLPIEILMRDYYEPRLLPRLLAGATLPSIPDLASINRVQPRIAVPTVEPMAGGEGTVRVKVVVEDIHDPTRPKGKDRSRVRDLRLFRDGRLVGYRDGSITVDSTNGDRAEVLFENVRIPRLDGVEKAEFSAYAFNDDRVKGATASTMYPIPVELPRRKGTAYLVAYGVDQFRGPQFKDLSCAARDARAFTDVVGRRLAAGGAYEHVVTVTLTSALVQDPADAATGSLDDHARKEDLETALRVLAGRSVDSAAIERLRPRIRGGDLAVSMPEDLVLVMTSTHGFTDTAGEFFLVPSDVRDAAFLGWEASCISSAELTAWMRDVDAAEIAMIVDACQSAGAVEQEGFKPGPLGSRGLGQLAYDKRMRLLAACQKAGVALEDGGLGHGFLTYALLHDGLGGDLAADGAPKDGVVTLGEWLAYARDRVPVLDEQLKRGERRQAPLQHVPALPAQPRRGDAPNTQTPSLFDFAKGRDPVVLARKP